MMGVAIMLRLAKYPNYAVTAVTIQYLLMHVAKLASMLSGFEAICHLKLDLSTAAKMHR